MITYWQNRPIASYCLFSTQRLLCTQNVHYRVVFVGGGSRGTSPSLDLTFPPTGLSENLGGMERGRGGKGEREGGGDHLPYFPPPLASISASNTTPCAHIIMYILLTILRVGSVAMFVDYVCLLSDLWSWFQLCKSWQYFVLYIWYCCGCFAPVSLIVIDSLFYSVVFLRLNVRNVNDRKWPVQNFNGRIRPQLNRIFTPSTRKRVTSHRPVLICPSVHLSHLYIVSKRIIKIIKLMPEVSEWEIQS